jgi:alkanesulfonate monooxygenase SsuD/methylene tetrahydromethanopterin reductase-like flavin-dependent oxidoreductase (luciferase family)
MEIAIGMPGMIPGVDSTTMREWAQRAERRGFDSLIFDDRLVWSGYEILISAAAAAAVTEKIKITTSVVVATQRTDVAEFAKQTASIDRISDGRFFLGLGVGSRADDFAAAGVDMTQRGKIMDALLERITKIWRGESEPIGPAPITPGGPPLLFGGASQAVFRRLGQYGVGWICATSGGVRGMQAGTVRAQAEWEKAGREGSPKICALTPRFSLGPDGQAAADSYLRAYNAYRDDGGNQRAAVALTTPALIHEQLDLFEEAGCAMLIMNPSNPDPDQVDLLADAIASR